MSEDTGAKKWYWRKSTLIIAVLSVGPLALPLVWFNPYLNRNQKIVYTIIIIVVSYFLIMWTINAYNKYMKIYDDLLKQVQ
ncbi:MAG: hypothetical protein PHD29_00540 [bacterium]|nr:hypothetical protein [bacterium]MDD5756196.1 hypothetical protein [bacterium]